MGLGFLLPWPLRCTAPCAVVEKWKARGRRLFGAKGRLKINVGFASDACFVVLLRSALVLPPSRASPCCCQRMAALIRIKSTYSSPSDPATADVDRPAFDIPTASRSFNQQYANLYWLRLAVLRPKVAQRAHALWSDMDGAHLPFSFGRAGGAQAGSLPGLLMRWLWANGQDRPS